MIGRLGVLALVGYVAIVAAVDSLPSAAVLAIGLGLCVIAGVVMVRSAVQR